MVRWHRGAASFGRVLLLVGVALALALAGQAVRPSAAVAAVPTVTSTADVATNFGACGNTTQTTSSGSLREAVCAANNAGTTAFTITMAPGTYTLANGELQMGKVSGSNITLAGAGAGSTIISGNNASRVFLLDPTIVGGVTTSISGVTITNGAVTTFGGAGIIAGSGHAATRDVLTLSNAVISNNHVNSTVSNKSGGGVEFQGGSLTVTNTTFTGNTSGSSSGSALEYDHYSDASGEQLTVSGSTFSGNSVNASVANVNVGGALHTTGVSASVPMSVTNSVFTGNTVVGSGTGIAQGGAIFAEGGGNLTVTESTFTGNSVTGPATTSAGGVSSGGAIAELGGTAVLHYNRFTGNVGANGSAVALPYPNNGSSVDAADNWWGCNAGPGTAGCDSVFGGPTVSPRLVLTATASPATVVGPNATSTITAALTTDSSNAAIATSNLDAFAGVPIAFSDPLPSGATVTPTSVNFNAGTASTTYNSQNTAGPGHVLATLDNGTATATLTVDRPPIITSANAASFTVGAAGSFTVTTAAGYPTETTITATGTLPAGVTFTDNHNGTATLSGTPTGGGTYALGLTASNGISPNATQTLTITVGQSPAFTSATTATFAVGSAGSFAIAATGPPAPTITETGTLPAGLTFVDHGNGTATLSGTPAAGSGGTYALGLTAANGINPNGTQTLTVTVNQATAVTTNPADQTVNAGASVSFSAAGSGFPAPTVQWQRSTNGGGSYSNIAGATGPTYTFTVAAADNGNRYRAVFTNSTGTATSTAATLTVHTASTITSANATSFSVGTAGSFTVTTSGFPNATLTTTGTLPAWLTFTDNGDDTATLAGTPPAGSGGQYGFTITAANGVAPAASQAFTLTVTAAPAITSADHASFRVGTAGSFTVTTTAGYPAATTLTKAGSLPSGVTFTDNGDGTASLAGTPAAGTAGSYPFTITASNGASTPATQRFTLTVTDAPVITSADHATFAAGTAGAFTVTTSRGAGTIAIGKTGTLPAGVTFTDNGDGTATLAGTPAANTGGSYPLTITASDGVTQDATQNFTLTVNQPPAITSVDHATFAVGTAGSFTVTTVPGVPVTTTITKAGALPAGVSFTDNGDGTATIAGTPTAGGSFPITITASNGVAPDATQAFTLTVNQAPAITSVDHTTFTAGTAGTFTVTTSPAADTVTSTGTLPSGVTFTDNGDGTATLAGTPAAGTGGVYTLSFKAANGTGFTTQSFILTVYEKAGITSADHTTFVVGTAGSFTVTTTAGYPVATTVTKTGSLPAGVTFTDNGDGTATIAGAPAAGTAGSYPLTIDATNAAGTRSQSFTLTVVPANAAPAITSVDHTTFAFGATGSFTVTTTAGYPTATTITETGALPAGVSFTDNGDGTATLAGTPTVAGVFPFTITASNGATTDATQSFTLTVTKSPTITSANHTTLVIGAAGSFTVTTTAGYPTATTLTETGALPIGVSFTDNGDGTATLAGTPAAGTTGGYALTLTASNAAGSTQQSFTLTVVPANASPVITSADNATFAFGVAGSFTVTTTAGYPTATTLTATGALPAGVTLTDSRDGTATLAGTPTASGAFPITIIAGNGASADATQSFTLTVTKVPAIGSADHTTFAVGSAGSFAVTTIAGYPTATTLTASGPLPAGVTFTDNGDGTATLGGAPTVGMTGSYPLTITATNAAGSAQQAFTLTVVPANASPAITSTDHATFTAGSAGTFTVTTTAGYPAATTITATGTLPAGVTFTDNHDGTATLAGTPAAGGGGTYALTVAAGNGVAPAATQAFTLTVDEAPTIISADHATFAVGAAGSFAVTARGFPAPTFATTSTLPAGVTLSAAGVLSGTPAAGTAGTYALTLTAANGVAPAATQAFTLTIGAGNQPPPAATVTAGAQGGGTVSPAGATAYPTGTLATYTATPAAGQLFLGWTLDGADVGFASPLTFTVASDRTLVARFAARPAFADVAGGPPAGEAIAQLAARGIVKGYGDGRYGPGDPVLRAQMAALIVRAFGWDTSKPGGPAPFSDLGGLDPELQRAIAILAGRGIIGGYGDGTFGPTDRVLHVQVISFIARAMVQAGYWTAVTQDDPSLYPNVPASSGHRLDLLTYTKYAGALPERSSSAAWGDWATPASRGWTAQVLWQALASQFGVDRVP